jgi:hypothetical protein
MDEYVLQMTNEIGRVIATESVQHDHHIISREEVEAICLTVLVTHKENSYHPTALVSGNERSMSLSIR